MNKAIKNLKSIITLLISLCILILLLCLIRFFSADLFQNMFKKAPWVQREIKTHTSITGVENKSELITARMNLDFINQLEGVDGRYIEILTYEVTAGIDSKQQTVKVLHSDQKDALILRDKISVDAFDSYTKPVKWAFEQKAKDYAVENGILQTAAEKGEKLLKTLTDSERIFEIEKYEKTVNLPLLPVKLEVAESLPLVIDEKLSTNENRFLRDSLVLRPENQNKSWSIELGDTGTTYSGSYKDFYKNFVKTNTNRENNGKDLTEIFRYFNPQNPNSSEVVAFASDFYRTFFVLNGSRIYYISANFTSQQELSDEIGPLMVYLACSMSKRENDKDLQEENYTQYVKNYTKVSQNLRQNDDVYTLENNVLNLIKCNGDRPLTPDEKLLNDLSNLKQEKPGCETEDVFINNSTDFYEAVERPELFSNSEQRNLTEQKLNQLDGEQIKRYRAYLYSYYLQNSMELNLTSEEVKQYKDYISRGDAILFSRDAIIDMTYEERNQYFKNVFLNHLKDSRRIIDTADNAKELLPSVDFEDNTFLYFDVDNQIYPPEEIIKEINAQNKNHPITECFILVFRQTEWNWGNLFTDTDIHALVLDDATLRIFPNVAQNKFSESVNKKIKTLFTTKNGIPFYYYGDWNSLQINPTNVKINGQSYETRRLTKSGRKKYTVSNEYAELSTMAQVLSDLQHAYYLEEPDYYLSAIKNAILEEMNYYVYRETFRPSPRLTIEKSEDLMRRYNY